MDIKIVNSGRDKTTSYLYVMYGVITVDSTHDHYNNKTYICQCCQYEQHLWMIHYIYSHIQFNIETYDTIMTTERRESTLPHTSYKYNDE